MPRHYCPFGPISKRTFVAVLIPLFAFSLSTHPFPSNTPQPIEPQDYSTFMPGPAKHSLPAGINNRSTVAASAESFDNCQSSSPSMGPGANSLLPLLSRSTVFLYPKASSRPPSDQTLKHPGAGVACHFLKSSIGNNNPLMRSS